MNLIEEFVPAAGYPSLKKVWKIYGIAYLIFLLPQLIIFRKDMVFMIASAVLLFIIMGISIMINRMPVSVAISAIDGSFKYRKMNSFGRESEQIVYLANARISYKKVVVAKGRRGYRLRLYNNYFTSKITLKEGIDSSEYNREQLDQMVLTINSYLGKHKLSVVTD